MMSLQPFKAKLTGVSPIMFHNERLANPTDPFTREVKKLSALKKKTDDILEDMKWMEWRGGFYEADGRPVVPADNVIAALKEGAQKLRKGKDVAAGVIEAEPHFLLEYDGPETIEGLRGNHRFCDYRTVVVSRRRVMRARPIFRSWSLRIHLLFDPEIIQESEMQQALQIAGERAGMCERRPRFGRFTAART